MDSNVDFVDKTVIVVGSVDDDTANHFIGGPVGNNKQIRTFADVAGSPSLNISGNDNNWINGATGKVASTSTIDYNSHIMQWSGGDPCGFVIDGTVDATTDTRENTTPFLLGNIGTYDGYSTAGLNGSIAELVILPSIPTESIRQKIEGYLAWKWGLQSNLPWDHPFKHDRPTTSLTRQLWQPSDITTEAWYDASDADTITESGGAVSQWDDKSGNGNDLTQPTAAQQLTTGSSTLNGLNVLEDRYIEQPFRELINLTVPINVFMVYNNLINASGDCFIELLNDRHTYLTNGIGGQTTAISWSRNVDTSGILRLGKKTATNVFVETNTVSIYDGEPNPFYDETDFVEIFLLDDITGDNRISLDLAEIIILDGTLSLANQQKIEGYLAWKWGLVPNLPSDHPYKLTPPTV